MRITVVFNNTTTTKPFLPLPLLLLLLSSLLLVEASDTHTYMPFTHIYICPSTLQQLFRVP